MNTARQHCKETFSKLSLQDGSARSVGRLWYPGAKRDLEKGEDAHCWDNILGDKTGAATTSFLLGFMSCSCQPGLFMIIFHLPLSFYFLSSAGTCSQQLGFSPRCGWLCPFIPASRGSSKAQSLTLAQAKQTSKQGADAQAGALMPPRLSQGHASSRG